MSGPYFSVDLWGSVRGGNVWVRLLFRKRLSRRELPGVNCPCGDFVRRGTVRGNCPKGNLPVTESDTTLSDFGQLSRFVTCVLLNNTLAAQSIQAIIQHQPTGYSKKTAHISGYLDTFSTLFMKPLTPAKTFHPLPERLLNRFFTSFLLPSHTFVLLQISDLHKLHRL